MGIETVALVAGAALGAASYSENRKARKDAERQAAEQREALAAAEAEATKNKPAMPVADDEATQRARKRSITAQLRRRGRASTILTSPEGGDALGA